MFLFTNKFVYLYKLKNKNMKNVIYALLVFLAVLVVSVYLVPIVFFLWKILFGLAIVTSFLAGIWVSKLFNKNEE